MNDPSILAFCRGIVQRQGFRWRSRCSCTRSMNEVNVGSEDADTYMLEYVIRRGDACTAVHKVHSRLSLYVLRWSIE